MSASSSEDILQKRRKIRRLAASIGILAASAAVQIYGENYCNRIAQHTSILTGRQWVQELKHGNENWIKNNLGMRKHVFRKLVQMLEEKGGLSSTWSLEPEEQAAIFLYFAVTNASNQKVAEWFQHSGCTISKYVIIILYYHFYNSLKIASRCFHRVLDALTNNEVYSTYIRLPNASSDVPDIIRNNPKFYPFFKDAQAAIDGTHILVFPPAEDRPRYRDHKGQLSQNVLASCTFDLQFCHILSGWEGSVSDSTLFADARKHDLIIPKGKYFLADAGFPLCRGLLVPYRGVRYHLCEWEQAAQRFISNNCNSNYNYWLCCFTDLKTPKSFSICIIHSAGML